MEAENQIERAGAPAVEQEMGAVAGPPEVSAVPAADAGEVQKPAATVEAAAPAAQEPEAAPAPPDRQLAAEMVTRFLGHQGGVAVGMIDELNDDEARGVIAAATDRHSAKGEIKSILSRAYDRRRDAAANEARSRSVTLRRSSLAQKAMQSLLGMSADDAADVCAKLLDDEQQALADLADSQPTDAAAKEQGNKVLMAAEQRAAAAAKANA